MTGFLFGKVPALGDFVARGLSPRARLWWDDRCSRALLDAQQRLGDDFDRDYPALPAERFVLAPTGGMAWQAGCVMPSRDRAGRAFPFVWGIASPVAIDMDDGAAIGERIAARLGDMGATPIDLDALAATAADLARDAVGERRGTPRVAIAPFPASGLEM
jgi:type VI secretion system protein ImpM